MINEPHAEALLDAARKVLMDELLPLLPQGEQYKARMIARAMGIAARELSAGMASDARTSAAIAQFFARAGMQGLAADEAALARLIRAGELPPVALAQLPELLCGLTRDKLALSNPKHLSSFAGSGH